MQSYARAFALFLTLGLAAAVAPPARGQAVTYTWSGGSATDSNWSSATNWAGGVVPLPDLANTQVVFGNAVRLTNVLDLLQASGGGAFDINSLTFNASAGAFVVNPTGTNVTGLNFGSGGLTVANNNNQTINVPVSLGATQTWTNSGTGRVFVNGPFTGTGQTLTLAGTGNYTYGGTVTGGAFNKTGAGNVTLTGNNAPASIAVSAGTLTATSVGGSNPLGTNNAPITLSGGTLQLNTALSANPIAVTGFNHDVITSVADYGSGAGYGSTRAVDGNNGSGAYTYMEVGTNGYVGGGLPTGGAFSGRNNPNVNYQLQPYQGATAGSSASNVLSLGGGGSGTLTLATPGQYGALSILNVTGSGTSTFSFTLNFASGAGTTVTGNTSPDWFGGADAVTAFIVNGRLNRGNGVIENQGSNNPRLYSLEYFLTPADSARTLTSITFNPTTTGTFNVFGVSGSGPLPAQAYGNPVTVTGNTTIQQTNTPVVSFGPLAIGSNTLTTTTNAPGSNITAGAVTLTGNPTFNVAANQTVSLGAVGDGGTARTITKTGAGTLVLSAPASSLGAGTALDVQAGTTTLGAAGSVGTVAGVVVRPGGVLSLGAGQTVASLNGTTVNTAAFGTFPVGGTVVGGANVLTVNGGTANTFAGNFTSGGLNVTGTGTAVTLAGTNTFSAGLQVNNGGRVQANLPSALGSSSVTLGNNGTLAVGSVAGQSQVVGFGGEARTGWTRNRNDANDNGVPAPGDQSPYVYSQNPQPNPDILLLTSAAPSLARSYWRNAAVPVGGPFTATFRFSHNNADNPADGITFAFQAAGLTALGGGGGALGYSGTSTLPSGATSLPVTPSAAFAMSAFNDNGVAVTFNGNGPAYTNAAPISLRDANLGELGPIDVTLNYTGSALSATLVQGANSRTFNFGAVNLLGLVGPQALIGFTGGTGGQNTAFFIENFTYQSTAASTYASPVAVSDGASATVVARATAAIPTLTMSTLALGTGSTLNVTADTSITPANQAYGLTFGAATLGGGTGTVNVANNGTGTGTATLGALSGTGNLTKTGAGTLILSAAANAAYAGTVSANAGVLRLTNTTGSATGTAAAQVNGGTLLNNGNIGAGGVVVNTGTLTNAGPVAGGVQVAGGTATNTAAITGAVQVSGGTFTNTSPGTVGGGATVSGTGLLTNNATITGGATVNGGTLNGSGRTNGAVAVNGGVVTGNGTFGGAVQVNTGGTVRPGASAAARTLTFESGLTFNGGGILRTVLFGTGATDVGLAAVTGNLAADPAALLQLDLSAVTPDALRAAAGGVGSSRVYTVATATGTVSNFSGINYAGSNMNGFENSEFTLLSPGGTPASVQIQFTPVPEPAGVLAAVAVVLGAGRTLRRRFVS